VFGYQDGLVVGADRPHLLAHRDSRLGEILEEVHETVEPVSRRKPLRIGGEPLQLRLAGDDVADDVLAPLGAHLVHEEEKPVPAYPVLGIPPGTEVSQDVLDVGRFHEPEASVLDERNPGPGKGHFKIEGMVARPEEHCYVAKVKALALEPPDLLANML
jgi:hypothetical protein